MILFPPGSTGKSLTVQVLDDNGVGVTALVAATFPSLFYQLFGANAAVPFPTLTDLALITTAWSAGGIKEISGGYYRVDAPDAMFAAEAKARLIGEATNKHVLCEVIQVSYPSVDLQTIKTQAITCAAGVTVLASVGTATTSTAQTGDNFARLGANGAGLTALGDARIANLDAAVSSRMATYAQPTGFLAATFPSMVASTTNVVLAATQTFSNTGTWTGNLTGAVGSVAGPVGSVTQPVTVGGYSSGQDPQTLVLDASASGHNSTGSIGSKINSAASAGDPWATVIPGSYVSGTAGNILGNRAGFLLAAAGLDAIVVETGINARQALAAIGAATAGKASGLDTSTATFYAMGPTGTATARIVATDDASGNRSAITLTLPA